MPSLKEVLEQRKRDLGGNKAKEGQLVEVEAQRLLLGDLTAAAEIAREVAIEASVNAPVEPTIADIININSLYQSYISPAYRILISRGEVEQPAVQTTPSSDATKTKDDLLS